MRVVLDLVLTVRTCAYVVIINLIEFLLLEKVESNQSRSSLLTVDLIGRGIFRSENVPSRRFMVHHLTMMCLPAIKMCMS